MERRDQTIDAGERGEADRLAYFQAVYEGYRRAEQAVGGSFDRFYTIGDYTVRLRFAGPALLQELAPALAHLATGPTDAPALTICLWDSASTHTTLPLLVASLLQLLRLRWWEQLDGRHEVKEYCGARIRTTFHLGPDILSVLDTQENLAVYWVEDARRIPYYERGYPLQAILNGWTQRHRRYYVHAGAVGTADGGVLLAGQGGAGKSTTTLACALSGLAVAGDDYTLAAVEPSPYGYSLYNTAKLRTREDLDKFPAVRSSVSNADRLDEEKPMIYLHEYAPRRVLHRFPIRAVLLPCVLGHGTDTYVQRTTAVAALKALAPSTILQLPGTGQRSFHAMSRLVAQVPCYTLALGTDLSRVPRVISRLLGELS